MESRIGEVRKVHVVYFLSRGGQVEHPHLIKVQLVALNGLRLRDVKRWLSKVRGEDMPDSFSWSYKRKYKSSFVWQDLRDDDLITPISDSEYVLKGSEILPNRIDARRCSCDRQTPERKSLQLEELRRIDEQPEDSTMMLELDLPLRQKVYEDSQNYSVQEPYKELPPLRGLRNYDECEDSGLSGEYYSAKTTSSNKPSKPPKHPDEDVRVYKAVTSPSIGPKLDAAAQTGESQRLFSDRCGISSSSDGARKVSDESPEKLSSPNTDEMLPNSLVPIPRKDTILPTCENTKFPPKESRQRKGRSVLASHVLKQLFRCGGLETSDSRIHSMKALPSLKNVTRSNGNADKAETQPELTNSNGVLHLQTLQEKSFVEKSGSKNSNGSFQFHTPVDSKREVDCAQNSSISFQSQSPKNGSISSQSQSSSSGEIATKYITGLETLQISPDSPAKVSQSPEALGVNVNDDISPLLKPKTIRPENRADNQYTRSKRRIRSILAK